MMQPCPQCRKNTLKIDRVMGSTKTVYYACTNCCYKDKRHYDAKGKEGEPIVTNTTKD